MGIEDVLMPIHFPNVKEIRLERPPVAEVISQVRFPAILKISEESPATFQEKIRDVFPHLDIEQGVAINVSNPSAMTMQPRAFRFSTKDKKYTATLDVASYALTTEFYTSWIDFFSKLEIIHNVAREVYNPPYANRIGLRYINLLTKENSGRNSLSEIIGMFRPQLVGGFNTEAWEDPDEFITGLVLRRNGDEKFNIRITYKKAEPIGILLDMDYYASGELNLQEFPEMVNRFHEIIYDAFRWSIREEELNNFGIIQ